MGMFVVAPASSFNHHHHHHHHHDSLNICSDPMNSHSQNAAATALGVGVIPLLTAAPCLASSSHQNLEDQDLLNNMSCRNKVSPIQFWQNQNPHQYLKKASAAATFLDHHNNSSSLNLIQSGTVTVAGGGDGGNNNSNNSSNIGAGSGSSSGTTCQDCGNQAKKDCSHRRCRTCCKSRGFDCSTHVKSTWVAAARRRERHLMTAAAGAAGSSGSTSGIKKPRLISSQTTTTSHTSTSNTTPPRSFDTTSSHQDASFKESLPGQVRAPAVFKCVRVTSVEYGEDEYAYQAAVKIGGHVFKGFLYDQGVVDQTREGLPNFSELHLGGGAGASSGGGGGGGGGERNGACSSSPNILDPSDVYAASAGGFLGGSSYGNPIN